MNEELQAKLLEYLEQLESGLHAGGDFVSEQAPLVVQEFLWWEWFTAAFNASALAFVALMCLVVGYFVVRAVWRWETEYDGGDGSATFTAFFMSFIVAICFAWGAVETASRCLKVSYAPRLVVIEKIQELVR